jgi:riboflavin biosynthesis pyrimidine reductase/pyrimidine deaminase RibD-like protein
VPTLERPLPPRPYVLISCAMSADGRIDDTGPVRLLLSGPDDLDRVDEVRASADAIVVGANTVRRDDPWLLIRSPRWQAARLAAGRPAHPVRVTVTASGQLDPSAHFFTGPGGPANLTGPGGSAGPAGPAGPAAASFPADLAGGQRLVYCASLAAPATAARLADRADVIDAGDPLSVRFMLADLAERGLARVLLEGGSVLFREFLTAGLADELHLAVAPFFVGEAAAPPFALPGSYPADSGHPMTLAGVQRLGGVVAMRYLLGPGGTDARFLRAAIELSRQCPPSDSAFAVGAVIVAADGEIIATGFSREQQPKDHAEEVALRKAGDDPRLPSATIYTSLVPCGARASRPVTCVQHILAAGIPRIVFAWDEPPIFTEGRGAAQLRAAGLTVVQIPGLAPAARAVNARVLGS